jgi:hypothetical protein
MLLTTCRSRTRCAWRHRSCATTAASSSLVAQSEHACKGRTMLARRALAAGDLVLEELPVVVGRCTTTGCAGCPPGFKGTASHWKHCGWVAAEKQPQLSEALATHRRLSSSAADVPPDLRPNHIRVACLFALAVQAVASPPLLSWALERLRPNVPQPGPGAPHWDNTAAFAAKFATVLPRPAGGVSAAAWPDVLAQLLVRLQTNLFSLDEGSIGLYPTAWLFEHACRPNAELSTAPDDGTLRLRCTSPVPAGGAVSFCYTAIDPRGDVRARAAAIRSELGFECRCAACESEREREI